MAINKENERIAVVGIFVIVMIFCLMGLMVSEILKKDCIKHADTLEIAKLC